MNAYLKEKETDLEILRKKDWLLPASTTLIAFSEECWLASDEIFFFVLSVDETGVLVFWYYGLKQWCPISPPELFLFRLRLWWNHTFNVDKPLSHAVGFRNHVPAISSSTGRTAKQVAVPKWKPNTRRPLEIGIWAVFLSLTTWPDNKQKHSELCLQLPLFASKHLTNSFFQIQSYSSEKAIDPD